MSFTVAMNKQLVAIGISAILVVAAIGGFAILGNSDGGDKENDHPLEGKWSLLYTEQANMVDDDHKPIMDASLCSFESRIYNPEQSTMTLEFKNVGKSVLNGKMGNGDRAVDFVGTIADNHKFAFRLSAKDAVSHMFIFEGVMKSDHIALTFLQLHTGNGAEQICCAGYALYVPEGAESIPLYNDKVSYNFDMERVSGTLHSIDDFKNGKSGEGKDIPYLNVAYEKSNSMVSVFNVTGKDGASKGVMALISLGINPSGNAYGIVGGNILHSIDGTTEKIYAFTGDTSMGDNRLTIRQQVHLTSNVAYFDLEYNVPYGDGKSFAPKFLENEYEGTVTIWSDFKDHRTVSITKLFKTYDTTVYGEETYEGIEYNWFGKINGSHVELLIESGNLHGHLEGHILSDGTLELSGVLYKSGQIFAYQYDLHPVSK